MDMSKMETDGEKEVLCAANSYTEKYYLNPKFGGLPKGILDELQILCVSFVEDVGGIVKMEFNEDGEVEISSFAEDFDYFYDEIGAGLIMRRMEREQQELFEALGNYYRIKYLNLPPLEDM